MVELKVGDTVKVIAQDDEIPYYTVGTIGKITSIISINDGYDYYELYVYNDWCYSRKQLIKGHMEFVSDEQ